MLLNAPHPPDQVWDRLPRPVQEKILGEEARAPRHRRGKVAREGGLGGRINTVMQTCFFALAGVLPRDEAIDRIKTAIEKTYEEGCRGGRRNQAAVDAALAALFG